MIFLRFVGDVPVWVGGLLALAVAIACWLYYRRESSSLSKTYRWLLPTLRASAFILAILLLTGPVLRHRQVEGELGRVRIYVDGSSSMSLHDQAMSIRRKLNVATQLEWIVGDNLNQEQWQAADELQQLRATFLQQVADGEATSAANTLKTNVERLLPQIDPRLQPQLRNELLPLLESWADKSDAEIQAQIDRVSQPLDSLSTELSLAADEQIRTRIAAGDETIERALARFDETTRWQRTEQALLSESFGLLEQLGEFHDVEVFGLVGRQAVPLASSLDPNVRDKSTFDPPPSLSSQTDLVTGITATQKTAGPGRDTDSSNTSQIVREAALLFTDGQHNSGPSPVELARQLADQGTPVFTVAVGSLTPANDLALISVDYPERVFLKDVVRGVMVIRDQARPGQPLLAQIKSEDRVLWQDTLLTQGTGERRIEFDFPLEEEVDRLDGNRAARVEQHLIPLKLEASLAPLAGEFETSNNVKALRVGVIAQVNNVLLLDGRSRWETRYLRNAFDRDQRWAVTTVVAGGGTENPSLPRGDQKDQFPLTQEALFDFDLVVLGEIDVELFAEHELEWLEAFVSRRGGGLVLIDGQRSKMRNLADSALSSLVPVTWSEEPVERADIRLDLTSAGSARAALRLKANELDNRQFWNQLPGPKNIQATEALPGSTVLVEAEANGRRLPAIVTRQVGAGKTLYMAFDETWRWRFKSADTWHQRIWNQLAIDVMPTPYNISDEFLAIDTGGLSYQAGDSAPIRVRLVGEDGQPNPGAVVDALIWNQDKLITTISLTPDQQIPGIYRGQTGPLESGDYRVTIRASGYGADALQAATEFVVEADESIELAETNVNQELLQQMARDSGGQFLLEEELQRLPELLRPFSSGRVVVSETPIWQSYWWFSLVVLLLALEWFLRKRAGLL